MTASELQSRARAMHQAALADHATVTGTLQVKPANSCSPPTAASASSDDTQEYTGDIERLIFATVIERFAKADAVAIQTTQGLTPDQWFALIGLIGDIVLKVIERRNQRPKP